MTPRVAEEIGIDNSLSVRIFADRREAGVRLGEKLGKYRVEGPVVLALPRGGVPVGFEVARCLEAPLDVLVARKLGTPGYSELAAGAIAENGIRVLNEDVIRNHGVTETQLNNEVSSEMQELERRAQLYRRGKSMIVIEDRTVIIVDDGFATGATAEAAIRSVHSQGAGKIVLAAPVGAPDTCRRLAALVDDLICVITPRSLFAVGEWYADFRQTSDDEVAELLASAGDIDGRE